jgi:hypothetical protein
VITEWKHDDLLHDLAAHLRAPDRMVWTDMQLGPSGSPRPDVFLLHKSYSRPRPTAFEIKVSRSDLRCDTTAGKWQSYLKYAGSVTFAVPDGLCTVADIPNGCGLIVRKKEVWRYVRKPTINPVIIPDDAWMKLLIDGVGRVSQSPTPQPRQLKLWQEADAIRKRFGQAVADAARDLTQAQNRIAELKGTYEYEYGNVRRTVEAHRVAMVQRAKDEAGEFERAKREILSWLGLDGQEHSAFSVRRRIERLRADCDADARVKDAERKLDQARYSIESALQSVSTKQGDIAA